MSKIKIKEIDREKAAVLIFKRKFAILEGKTKKEILADWSILYGRFLAVCSDESFDREINSLDI